MKKETECYFIVGRYRRIGDVSFLSLLGIRIYQRVNNFRKILWFPWMSIK